MEQNEKSKIVRFLSAQTISLLGSSIVQYGMIWYITLTTTSGLMIMISTLCGFLPQILIALFAGKWIDRYDAKKVVMVSDAMIAFVTLLLAICFLLQLESLWLVFVVLGVRSLGTGMQTPCVNTLIPQIVSNDYLMRVNGINSTLNAITMFISPMLSGMLLSLASLEILLMIDVITAIIGIGITATITIKKKQQTQEVSNQIEESKSGLAYVKQHKKIAYLLIFQFVIYFLITPAAFLTPLMIARRFGKQVWRLTMSEMSYSLGMVLGGILISTWQGFKEKTKTMVVASVCYGMLMITIGVAQVFLFYLIMNAFIGVVTPCYGTSITVYLQEKVKSSMHGRIFSLMQIATSCAFPIGMCLFGPLADYVAVPYLLVGCGILVIASTYVFQLQMKNK